METIQEKKNFQGEIVKSINAVEISNKVQESIL
jgi:hypothetical protein